MRASDSFVEIVLVAALGTLDPDGALLLEDLQLG